MTHVEPSREHCSASSAGSLVAVAAGDGFDPQLPGNARIGIAKVVWDAHGHRLLGCSGSRSPAGRSIPVPADELCWPLLAAPAEKHLTDRVVAGVLQAGHRRLALDRSQSWRHSRSCARSADRDPLCASRPADERFLAGSVLLVLVVVASNQRAVPPEPASSAEGPSHLQRCRGVAIGDGRGGSATFSR